MMVRAVIDRFGGNFTGLSIGKGDSHLETPRTFLPEACQEDVWLKIEVEGNILLEAEIDREETAKARDRIAEKLANLRKGEHLK